MTDREPLPTLRYALIQREQYVEVQRLVELLRLNGEDSAADLLEESATGREVSRWKVKP